MRCGIIHTGSLRLKRTRGHFSRNSKTHRLARSQPPMVCRKPMAQREVDIIRCLKRVIKMPVADISRAVDRNKSSVYKVLRKTWKAQKRGRPASLSYTEVSRLVKTTRQMVEHADTRWEVTLAMIKHKTKCKACESTIRKSLVARGIRFRRLRSKPILSKADRRARFAFAKKYWRKSVKWWLKKVHLHIDLKNFQVYPHAKARAYAAQRAVRGAYRGRGEGLGDAYVVASKSFHYNPGAKSARVAAGVGNGRVRMWTVVPKTWNGAAAAKLYEGPVKAALTRTWPRTRTFKVLEDNDPTGFKSKKGVAAKRRAGIHVFTIPKRSPDLNVCDYSLWATVNRSMRRQEKQFRASKRETRQEFLTRLHKTATGLSKRCIDKAIGDMRRRCQRLHAARGGLFEEGGRPCRR